MVSVCTLIQCVCVSVGFCVLFVAIRIAAWIHAEIKIAFIKKLRTKYCNLKMF